ncbi:tail tube [Escherichia phage vB_EcoM_005]|uniref:Baseplate tail tube initiator n=1 Tax=Escherichia phage vB_EcoM_005 TaxID=2500761 RepID=A0A3Q9R9F4_9CAUD|nr:tail tube [Escherichia phage vB_EcoM_005]AZV00920.1 baseplate tail tube initiator [Escherichia phage vB_EcoM_005]
MYTLQEFQNQAINIDLQRNNLFSVVFATVPSSKSQALLDQFGGALFNNIPLNTDLFGITQGELAQGVTTLVTAGTQKLIRKSGISKYLIGAMSSRVVQSLLGEFEVGTYLMDFFNMAYPTAGLLVHAVKIPDNTLNYEMDLNHNSPNIKITGREYSPLVLSFRMDSEAANYRAFNDWVNSVQDNGCVPVGVSSPELSYDGDNQIASFDVTFAYRSVQTGAVGKQAAYEWLEDKIIKGVAGLSESNSLSSSVAKLSRLSGASSGLTGLVNTFGGRAINNGISRLL